MKRYSPEIFLDVLQAVARLSAVAPASSRNSARSISRASRPLLLTIVLTSSLIAALLTSFSVFAQSNAAQQTSIGFVDIPYIINNAPQAVEAERRLESEFAPREEELKLQRQELADVSDKLKSQALELSESEIAQLNREMRNLERRIKRDEQDFREELNIQKNNEFKKVRILVLEAIAKFGQANNYDLIVSDGVLYANKQIDVTEKILDSLRLENQKLQSSN